MPPPQHKQLCKVEGAGRNRIPLLSYQRDASKNHRPLDPLDPPCTTITTKRIRKSALPWSLFPVVLFVFVSCVVPLSTPSSTHESVSTTIATLIANGSLSNRELRGSEYSNICPTAKLWIQVEGSFCFTLRKSSFLRNVTELRVRERRAIDMFCELDRILEKVDCAQPYSVNVERKQCWLCREAYRDWTCAMTTDTLEDGRMDCEGGVMPCPSCASICHQVMRLCPYLTPDRVQFDENGEATPHVSQYGGHPAFYCPLENIHASDPAYRSDCSKSSMYDDPGLHDNLHNSCAENAKYMSKRSASTESTPLTHISTCCWTYASSLVHDSEFFENNIRDHGSGFYGNRIVLNCCDSARNCISSDPDSNVTVSEVVTVTTGSTLRTANNQVRGEDGTFRELSNAYLHDDVDEEDEDYYDDSSSSDTYSSGGSSNEYSTSIHRDNKVYRRSRSVHEPFYLEAASSASASVHVPVFQILGFLGATVIPPLLSFAFLLVLHALPNSPTSSNTRRKLVPMTTITCLLVQENCCSRHCSRCEVTIISIPSNLMNLPITIATNSKLVVNRYELRRVTVNNPTTLGYDSVHT